MKLKEKELWYCDILINGKYDNFELVVPNGSKINDIEKYLKLKYNKKFDTFSIGRASKARNILAVEDK